VWKRMIFLLAQRMARNSKSRAGKQRKV